MKSLKYDFFNSNNTRNFQVYNDTGSSIPANRVVRVVNYNSTNNAVEVEPVSSYSHKALGVTDKVIANGGRGDVVVTGLITMNTATASLLDPVFFSTSGTLVFSGPSTARVGYVVSPGANGKVFINLSGSGGDGANLSHNVLDAPDASLKKGMPVYWNGIKYLPAVADDIETVAIGIISELGTNDYTVQFAGMLTLTTSEWNQITGSTGGLTPGLTYYLDDGIPGRISILAPAISNAVLIGVSPTEAIIQLKVLALPEGGGDSIIQEVFVSTSGQKDFTLTQEPLGKAYTWVTLNGLLENEYSIVSGTTIRLDETIPGDIEVDIRYVKFFNIETRNQIYTFVETVVSGPKTEFTLPITPNNVHNIFVFVDGSLQMDSYSFVGPTLTFDTPIANGQRVYAKVMQAVNYDADINNYIKRKTVILTDGSNSNINTIFEENVSAKYEIQIEDDPRIFMTARLKAGTGADFFTTSGSAGQIFGTPGLLNVDYNNSTLRIENQLGSTKTITIVRQT